ncbi:COG1361 S-layer family protein [Halorussus amylolyticus]|uniref:COG1361 S-layer family protein n=1 Tax=Halorussus amylolyticus TaxID=1126242 RepID=UPI0010451F79|nr:DUF11 domain-containing protein [Halorussus amylolyticus]
MRPGTLLVVALVVAAGVTPVLAQEEGTVVGRPNVELSATENRIGAGERVTLEVFASNNGDIDRGGPAQYEERVTTARNVRLEIDEDRMDDTLRRGIDVRSGEVLAGSVPEGASGPFAFTFDVSESLDPGTYQIPVEVTYDYTNFVRYRTNAQPEYGDGTRTQTAFVTVVVEDRPEFAVTTENLTSVPAGDTATYRLNVTNTGTQTATDTRVALSAGNSSIFFGGADTPQDRTSVFLGRLESGESQTFEVTVGASEDTAPGTYLADAVVSYQDPNGVSGRSDSLSFGVAVGGEQAFGLRNVDSNLTVGDTGVVTGRVVNTGNANVTDAVVVLGGGNDTLRPRETEYAVGDLGPGESANFSFRVDTANTTDPGPRQLDFSVQYRNREGDTRTSDPLDARIAVAREQTFALRNATSDLRVGDSGTVSGTVVNTGEVNATDAVVVFRTENPNLQPRESEVALGDLGPGESADFEYTVDVPNASDPGLRQVSFRVRYRNQDGETRFGDELDAQVAVGDEQTFDVREVGGSLRVGETGDLLGSVVNTGDRPASNAVVVVETENPNLQPRETEYAVGDLAPGESVPFEFAVDVNTQAEPGPRQVSFRVRYRNQDGDLRVSETIDARVEVAPDVDEFEVEPVNATLSAGSSAVVEFRVTNAGNETLEDVEAKLFASDPLSSDNDEAFVPRLEPGESATLVFGMSAAGGAIPKVYPVSMDFNYENERGDSVLSDTYRVPVTVTEAERGGFGLPSDVPAAGLVALGGAVVVLALAWWKRDSLARLLS